jgi:hypothetical protein
MPAPRAPSAGVLDPRASEPLAPEPVPPAQFDGALPPATASSTEPGAGRTSPPSITHFTAAPEPSAADVEHAMHLLSSKLDACVRGATGKILVDATLLPSGRVSAVKLPPPFAGTPREACVRHVVESLHFPSWTGSPRTYRFAIAVPEVLSIPQAHPSEGPGSPP